MKTPELSRPAFVFASQVCKREEEQSVANCTEVNVSHNNISSANESQSECAVRQSVNESQSECAVRPSANESQSECAVRPSVINESQSECAVRLSAN